MTRARESGAKKQDTPASATRDGRRRKRKGESEKKAVDLNNRRATDAGVRHLGVLRGKATEAATGFRSSGLDNESWGGRGEEAWERKNNKRRKLKGHLYQPKKKNRIGKREEKTARFQKTSSSWGGTKKTRKQEKKKEARWREGQLGKGPLKTNFAQREKQHFY